MNTIENLKSYIEFLLHEASLDRLTWDDCLARIANAAQIPFLALNITIGKETHCFSSQSPTKNNSTSTKTYPEPQQISFTIEKDITVDLCFISTQPSSLLAIICQTIEHYLTQSLPHWLRHKQYEQNIQALLQVIEKSNNAIAYIDSKGNLIHQNSKLSAVLSQRDGIQIRNGKLNFDSPNATKSYRAYLDTISSPSPHSPVFLMIKRPSGRKDYIMELSKLDFINPVQTSSTVAGMITIKSFKSPPPIYKDSLIHVFGLTKTESLICYELFLNKSEQEIADTHHISLNTVKTHRKRIYSKLHITNRAELIILGYNAFL